MTSGLRVFRDTYVDSVMQLAASRAMNELDGVDWAAAAMATPANLRTLAEEGFSTDDLGSANDLFLAVRGRDDDVVQDATRRLGAPNDRTGGAGTARQQRRGGVGAR
jgi:FdrA protein